MPETISSNANSSYKFIKSKFLTDFAKRLLDITASSLGLLFLAPLFFYLAWRIKQNSPGPVFYCGRRYGRGGRVFYIYKFRTMYESPESYAGPSITAEDDPRITPLGKWLRDSKLNELPQLWNVLIGDMSLVGPRPEALEIVDEWPNDARGEILSVRPGVTSPASVLYRNEEALLKNDIVMGDVVSSYLEAIVPSKLRLDQLYVRHRSFLLDLDVIFWTFTVLMPMSSNSAPMEEKLFLGPLSRLSRWYLKWFVIDTLVTLVAILASAAFFRTFGPLNLGILKVFGIALGFAILFSLTCVLFGVNRVEWSKANTGDAFGLVTPVIIGTLAAVLVDLLWDQAYTFPYQVVLMAAALALGGFVLVRYRSRILAGLALRWLDLRGGGAVGAQERVLILGGGEGGQFMAWLLQNGSRGRRFKVIGFVDDDLFKVGTRIKGVNVLGRRSDLPRLVERHDAGLIIFAIHNISHEEREELLKICTETSAKVVMIPDILGALYRLVEGDEGNFGRRGKDVWEDDFRNSECDISLSDFHNLESFSIPYLDEWLVRLEKVAVSGNAAAIESLISEMRCELRDKKMLTILNTRDDIQQVRGGKSG